MSGLLNFINLLERLNSSSDILERSLQEDTAKDKPCETEFVSDLNKVIITNEHVDNNLCCAICQDTFKLGDKCIKLPCGDPHFFHCEADPEICEGILPWLKKNNTCPVCRMEFPEEINENPDEQRAQEHTSDSNEDQSEDENIEETNENPDEQDTHNEAGANTLQDMVHLFTHELYQRNELFNTPHATHPQAAPDDIPHIHHPNNTLSFQQFLENHTVNIPSYPFNIGNIVYIPLTSQQAANLDNNDDDIYDYDTDLQEAIRRSLED